MSSDRGVKSGPLCTVTLVALLFFFCLGFPGHAPFTAPFTSLYRSLYRRGYRSLYLVSTKGPMSADSDSRNRELILEHHPRIGHVPIPLWLAYMHVSVCTIL